MKKQFVKSIFAFALALAMTVSFAACEEYTLISLIREQTEGDVPDSAAALIQTDLYQTTVNNVEITIREAAYDGRSLFLVYSFRMTDVDHPLGMTAADYYGDELPEDIAPDEYVYSLTEDAEDLLAEHNVGWWIDDIWFDSKPMIDMPNGSGQFLTGTGNPGELVECDIWRLDNLGIALKGKVQISLPIGNKQDYMDYYGHEEKYDADGLMKVPEEGVVTFEFDAKDYASFVRVFRPETETVLPEVTVSVREAAFSPVMTYIRLDLAVNPNALEAFIAENGEGVKDESGEIVWPYGPMDVIGEWLESMQLTDGNGTILFPDNIGPSEYSDENAEFVLPYLETLPEALYLAPVGDEGVADMDRAVPVLPADS